MNQFKGQPTRDCPEIIQSSSSLKKGSVFQDQKPALCALNGWPNESGRIDTRVNHNRMLGAALPFFVLFCLSLFATDALAAQVTLAWDANDPTPDGYRLYQRLSGESFDYDQPVWTGSATTAPIDGLTEGTTYYFVVRAYVGADESGDSNEVEYTPPEDNQATVNHAPYADAGDDQSVLSEARVTLNGTGSSDPDGDALSYSWVQTSGPSVVLSNANRSWLSFYAPAVSSGNAVLVFTLTVTDPLGVQAADQCRITVVAPEVPETPAPVNQAPSADAGGDQTVPSEALVTLNGTGSSDPDEDSLSYAWVQTSGTAVVLSTVTQSSFSFSAPTVSSGSAVLVFTLTVTDPSGAQASDQCRITVEAPEAQSPINQSPMANAGGDQTVPSEALVTLNGTGSSDPDGDSLSYAWSQTSGTAVVLSTVTQSSFSFSAPTVSSGSEMLVFTLTVTDPSGAQASDQCRITVEAPTQTNEAPVANAGDNQTVKAQSHVTLDGSGSYAPEGQSLTYLWHQTSGLTVALSQSDSIRATFVAPDNITDTTTLAFELTVTDSQGASSADTCLVVIEPLTATDSDGDGIDDDSDAFPNDPDEWADNDHDGTGDNADTDDDNDGMPDAWEKQYGLDPFTSDAGLDADGDGITNLEEYQAGSNPADGEGDNQAPARPTILSPEEMETVAYDKLKIRASSFYDPNQEDQHGQTQWLITSGFPQHVVLNVTLDRFGLTSFWVPRLILDPGVTYTCMVRYFDDHGKASGWSLGIEFTTQTWLDQNADETSIDLNSDQISDSLQTDIITSLRTYDGKRNVGISLVNASNTIQILSADTFNPENLEEGAPSEIKELPYGMFGYKIAVSHPGQTATVGLLFSDPLDSEMQWYRYNSISGWRTISESIDIDPDIEGVVQRQITDGSEEDADGVANGIIVELMGPAFVDTSDADTDSGLFGDDTAMSGGGGGGGCFLQTLTF